MKNLGDLALGPDNHHHTTLAIIIATTTSHNLHPRRTIASHQSPSLVRGALKSALQTTIAQTCTISQLQT